MSNYLSTGPQYLGGNPSLGRQYSTTNDRPGGSVVVGGIPIGAINNAVQNAVQTTSWWDRNSGDLFGTLRDILSMLGGGSRPTGNNQPAPPPQDNTTLYAVIGLGVLMLVFMLIFIFKK